MSTESSMSVCGVGVRRKSSSLGWEEVIMCSTVVGLSLLGERWGASGESWAEGESRFVCSVARR